MDNINKIIKESILDFLKEDLNQGKNEFSSFKDKCASNIDNYLNNEKEKLNNKIEICNNALKALDTINDTIVNYLSYEYSKINIAENDDYIINSYYIQSSEEWNDNEFSKNEDDLFFVIKNNNPLITIEMVRDADETACINVIFQKINTDE